jgi:hypothetical protein
MPIIDFLTFDGRLDDDRLAKTIFSNLLVNKFGVAKRFLKTPWSRNGKDAQIPGDAEVIVKGRPVAFELKLSHLSPHFTAGPRFHFSKIKTRDSEILKAPVDFVFCIGISPASVNEPDWPENEKLHRMRRGCPPFNHSALPKDENYLTNCNFWIIPYSEITVDNELDIYVGRFRNSYYACSKYTCFYVEGYDLEACHILWEKLVESGMAIPKKTSDSLRNRVNKPQLDLSFADL